MSREEPLTAARRFVADCFAGARWAVLSGSVVAGNATPGSDLDIVILLPDGDIRPPFRASRIFAGWPVEMLVYDEKSLRHYLAKELPDRRPVLNQMVASGVHIGGEEVTHLADLQDQCAKTLKAGPEPLTVPERRWARYRLTDLLDDLTHATDAGERAVIAAALWIAVAEDHLTLRGRWRGTGKWLLRQLRDADAGFAQRWLDAGNDPEKTAEIAREVLTALGGPLFDGYHAGGESPES